MNYLESEFGRSKEGTVSVPSSHIFINSKISLGHFVLFFLHFLNKPMSSSYDSVFPLELFILCLYCLDS